MAEETDAAGTPIEPVFFATPAEFRAWLEAHHATAPELVVGLYKKGSGKPSITWREAVDEALCFGWIDGRGKRIDDVSHAIRFTPRRPRSIWSAVNIKRVEELTERGLMRPAGLKAFEARTEGRSGVYAHEQKPEAAQLAAADEQQFRAAEQAWAYFQAQAAWYRRAAIWWVVSAKREETRRKRLATLIDDSAQGRPIKSLTRPTKAE